MDLFSSMAISASALEAHKTRLMVIATNLANAQSTRGPDGEPYRRRDVVFQPSVIPSPPFKSALQGMGATSVQAHMAGVKVAQIIEDPRPFQERYEPQHPDADPDGFVKFPNINVIEEMVNMMAASRAYEANVQALNATKTMARSALSIGR